MSEIVQLPPGWEAIYSEQVKRYYFVDHISKRTTWEDPRLTHPFIWSDRENGLLSMLKATFIDVPETTLRESLLKTGFNIDETRKELEAKFKRLSVSEDSRKNESKNLTPNTSLKHNNRRTSSPSQRSKASNRVQVDEFSFLAVKSKFPEVPDEILNEVLKSCNNDEENACKELNSMGFDRGRNRQNAMSRVERAEMSREEKQKSKEAKVNEAAAQLMLEFPGVGKRDLRQALADSNEELAEARSLLNKLEAAKKLEALKKSFFEESNENGDQVNNASTSAVIVSTVSDKEEQIVKIQLPMITIDLQKETEVKPIRSTIARGPDKSNWRGPNKGNLLSCRVMANGPNKSACTGPDPKHLQIASFQKYTVQSS